MNNEVSNHCFPIRCHLQVSSTGTFLGMGVGAACTYMDPGCICTLLSSAVTITSFFVANMICPKDCSEVDDKISAMAQEKINEASAKDG